MDPIDPLRLTRELVDIDSTTGREGGGRRLAGARACGSRAATGCRSSPWTPRAASTYSRASGRRPPAVVFSTHYDCVPPFFPSRVERGLVFGRGSCDAKGILAAQVAAVERLRACRGGAGRAAVRRRRRARAATARRVANTARYRRASSILVNGEPTDNRLGTATRGECSACGCTHSWARGALRIPGVGGIGHRQVAGCADGDSGRATSLRTRCWVGRITLFGRPD